VTDPGLLNQRLVLDIPVETADGAGGAVRGYAAGPKLWAAVRPVRARGDVVAASAGATVTHAIVIRARSDVTTRHRLRNGARVFHIVSLREQDSSNRFLVIDAQERRD
jgi:SPP1 family predicted phage head-tail adaptor